MCIGFVHEQHCYKIHTPGRTWFEARDYCIEQGGHLAEACNADLNAVFTTTYRGIFKASKHDK